MQQTEQTNSQEVGGILVELMVLLGLLVVVVGLSTRSREPGRNNFETQELAARNVLDSVRDELVNSSLNKAPQTNQLRYSIQRSKQDRQSLTFMKLDGITVVDGEVEGVWSSPITLTRDNRGRAVRTQAGRSSILGKGLEDLRFEVIGGRFRVTAVTLSLNPRNGQRVVQKEAVSIRPMN